MWFVVETITHYENTTIPSPYHEEPSIHFTDVCAVVIISDRQSRLSPIYKNVQVQNQSYSPGYTSYQREDSYTTGIIVNVYKIFSFTYKQVKGFPIRTM